MALVSFVDRDMDKDPFTIGEFIEILSEYDPTDELRFNGMCGELFFHRFKSRGDRLMTIEFDDPDFIAMAMKPENGEQGTANP